MELQASFLQRRLFSSGLCSASLDWTRAEPGNRWKHRGETPRIGSVTRTAPIHRVLLSESPVAWLSRQRWKTWFSGKEVQDSVSQTVDVVGMLNYKMKTRGDSESAANFVLPGGSTRVN